MAQLIEKMNIAPVPLADADTANLLTPSPLAVGTPPKLGRVQRMTDRLWLAGGGGGGADRVRRGAARVRLLLRCGSDARPPPIRLSGLGGTSPLLFEQLRTAVGTTH